MKMEWIESQKDQNTNYVSCHLKGDYNQKYRLYIISKNCVNISYRHQNIRNKSFGSFGEQILLKLIQTNNAQNQFQFRFYEKEPRKSCKKIDPYQLDMNTSILFLLQIAQITSKILNLGFNHSFSPEDILFQGKHIYFHNFIYQNEFETVQLLKPIKQRIEHLFDILIKQIIFTGGQQVKNIRYQLQLQLKQKQIILKLSHKQNNFHQQTIICFSKGGIRIKDEQSGEYRREELLQNCSKYFFNHHNRQIRDIQSTHYKNNIGCIWYNIFCDKVRIGTATLMSRNIIMTAAHNLYTAYQNQAKQFLFIDARENKIFFTLRDSQYQVQKKYYFSQKYLQKMEDIKRKIEQLKLESQFKARKRLRQQIDHLKQESLKYDIILLKLKNIIQQRPYIELIKNYDKTTQNTNLKGFRIYQQQRIFSKMFESKQTVIQIEQKATHQYEISNQLKPKEYMIYYFRQQNKIHYNFQESGKQDKAKSSEEGCSGGPIFIILTDKSEDESDQSHKFYYYFMIGFQLQMIRVPQRKRQGQLQKIGSYCRGLYLTQETIQICMAMESKLIGGNNDYRVFNKNQILDMNDVREWTDFFKEYKIKSLLDGINFQQKERQNLESKFNDKNYKYLSTVKDKLKKEDIYNYNNGMFIYHIRSYQHGQFMWKWYQCTSKGVKDCDNGDYFFFFYIFNCLKQLFNNVLLTSDQDQRKFKIQAQKVKNKFLMLNSLSNKETQQYILNHLVPVMEDLLKNIAMNQNFRKIVQFEITFMKLMRQIINKQMRQCQEIYRKKVKNRAHDISKLFIYILIGYQLLQKLAIVNQKIKQFCHDFPTIIFLLMKQIRNSSSNKMKEIRYSFYWSIQPYIKQFSSAGYFLFLIDPLRQHQMKINQNKMNMENSEEYQEQKKKQKNINTKYLQPYLQKFLVEMLTLQYC